MSLRIRRNLSTNAALRKGDPIDQDHVLVNGYFYNLQNIEDSRVILFTGKNGRMVRTEANEVIYVGGYTGNKFNSRIAVFSTDDNSFCFKNDIFAKTED